MPLGEFLESVSAAEPAPGGGSVSAIAVALAAGLSAMAARFSTDHLPGATQLAERADELRQHVAPLAQADAEAYRKVLDVRRQSGRSVEEALSEAADVPLAVAEVGEEVAGIAHHLAERGNPNLHGDATSAVLLAGAATRAAATLAGINLSAAGIEDGRLERAHRLSGAM